VVGRTGVALDETGDVLYVASAIDHASDPTTSDAGLGRVVVDDSVHLRGPLGLALAPNGDLVSAQGDAVNPNPDPNGQSLLLEFTPAGAFVPAEFSVEPTTAGAAFRLAVEPKRQRIPIRRGEQTSGSSRCVCSVPPRPLRYGVQPARRTRE
jgi:hypothetical protein